MRARSYLAIIAAASLSALASCAIETFTIESTASSTSGSGGAGGAGGAGGGEGGEGGDGICGHASYPGPPGTTVPGNEEFTVAIRSIDLGEKRPTPPGLDLDGKCSCCCEGEGSSCIEKKTVCDYPLGVDNAASGMFKLVAVGLDNFSSSFFSEQAEVGNWSFLLRIRNYTGTADDDQVEVAWFMSDGVFNDQGMPIAPSWDGNDAWTINSTSMSAPDGGPADIALGVEGNVPLYLDSKAYITNHTLVASLPDAEILLGGGNSRITFHLVGAFLVADVVEEPNSKKPMLNNALLVGRWRTSDLFRALSTYRNSDGSAFCTDDNLYKIAKPTICNSVDIYSGIGTPTTPCDSFSLGMEFTTFPAKIKEIVQAKPASPGCPPETDPINDSCATVP